jgi:hypothetical protein
LIITGKKCQEIGAWGDAFALAPQPQQKSKKNPKNPEIRKPEIRNRNVSHGCSPKFKPWWVFAMAKVVVRERHVRALYVNVPVPVAWLQAQLVSPAVPDVFDDKAWVSIVVDDLFKIEAPMGRGFLTMGGMNGWMMKCNALVKSPVAPGVSWRIRLLFRSSFWWFIGDALAPSLCWSTTIVDAAARFCFLPSQYAMGGWHGGGGGHGG